MEPRGGSTAFRDNKRESTHKDVFVGYLYEKLFYRSMVDHGRP